MENEKVIKAEIEGPKGLNIIGLFHHEGVDWAYGHHVRIVCHKESYSGLHIRRADPFSIDFLVNKLNKPFSISIKFGEQSSRTGLHQVATNVKSSEYLFTIDSILRFPKGIRPKLDEVSEALSQQNYIMWAVSEGVDVVWILKYAGYNEMKIKLPFEDLQELTYNMQELQGHLRFIEVDTNDIEWFNYGFRKANIYGHKVECYNAAIAPIRIYSGILALLHMSPNSVAAITITHQEHERIELITNGEGKTYLLWHPHPAISAD